MAMVTPTPSARKKRLTTYSRKNSPAINGKDFDFFGREDEPGSYAHTEKAHRHIASTIHVKSPAPVTPYPGRLPKPSSLPPPPDPVKDVFEFVSSEDDNHENVPRKSAVRAPAKRPLVLDRSNETMDSSDQHTAKKVKIGGSNRKSVAFIDTETIRVGSAPAVSPVKPLTMPTKSTPAPARQKLGTAALKNMSTLERFKHKTGRKHTANEGDDTNPSSAYTRSPVNTTASTPRRKAGQLKRASHQDVTLSPDDKTSSVRSNVQIRTKGRSRSDDQTSDVSGLTADPGEDHTISNIEASASPPRRSSSDMSPGPSRLTPKQKRKIQDIFDKSDHISSSNKARDMVGQDSLRKQKRLVDRLKAAAPPIQDTELTDDESDVSDEPSTPVSMFDETLQSPPGQSRAPPASAQSKRTYVRQRSHLADTSLEDSTQPSPVRNLAGMGGLSAMGLDDEDEDTENAVAKVRSVHELKAKGRSSRATLEFANLLSTVFDKSTTQVARLLALVKLTSRLLNEQSLKSFIHNDHHTKLFEDLQHEDDELRLAFGIMIAIMLLLTDNSEPTLRSVCQYLTVAGPLLKQSDSIVSLLKDDSKLAKAIPELTKLVTQLAKTATIWQDMQNPQILSPRMLYLRAWDLLARKSQSSTKIHEDLLVKHWKLLCGAPHFFHCARPECQLDNTLVISILESSSTYGAVSEWPLELMQIIASLPDAISQNGDQAFSQHSRFLAYRLCLNVTNTRTIDHVLFAKTGSFKSLLSEIVHGFEILREAPSTLAGDQEQSIQLDLLILALGIVVNISEYCSTVRESAGSSPESNTIAMLVETFNHGLQRVDNARSVDESILNVPYGYLAVMLASLCQSIVVRSHIVAKLTDQDLGSLVKAVDEFIKHHQKVDDNTFDGAEGREALKAFTDRLKAISTRLLPLV